MRDRCQCVRVQDLQIVLGRLGRKFNRETMILSLLILQQGNV